MSLRALTLVKEKYPDAFVEQYTDRTGGAWGVLKPDSLRQVLAHLKDDPQLDFKLFLSMDAVDRLQLTDSVPRFEVVYFLYSVTHHEHLRLKIRAGEEAPEIPSATSIFQGANWWERFVWDFYGIKFTCYGIQTGWKTLMSLGKSILVFKTFQIVPPKAWVDWHITIK